MGVLMADCLRGVIQLINSRMSSSRLDSEGVLPEEVHIYIRNSQKRAHFLTIAREIRFEEIRRIISERIKVPSEKLVLFLKGEQLAQEARITLQEKCIVHLVNLDNVHKDFINLHIKRLEGEKLISHFKVPARSNIKQFIDTRLFETFKLNSEEIFLVYTGKQLDMHKTFEEEFVEDESELLCVNLEQSEFQGHDPSALTQRSHKKIEKSSNPEIELGPGKPYTETFQKKPTSSQNNAAPGSQQEIPIAPPNVYKKENIPKEINPEDFKKGFTAPLPVHFKAKEEEAPHTLHSAVPRPAQVLRSEAPEPDAPREIQHDEDVTQKLQSAPPSAPPPIILRSGVPDSLPEVVPDATASIAEQLARALPAESIQRIQANIIESTNKIADAAEAEPTHPESHSHEQEETAQMAHAEQVLINSEQITFEENDEVPKVESVENPTIEQAVESQPIKVKEDIGDLAAKGQSLIEQIKTKLHQGFKHEEAKIEQKNIQETEKNQQADNEEIKKIKQKLKSSINEEESVNGKQVKKEEKQDEKSWFEKIKEKVSDILRGSPHKDNENGEKIGEKQAEVQSKIEKGQEEINADREVAHEVQEAVHEVKEEAANHVQEVAHQVEEDHSSEVKLHSAPHFEEVAHQMQEAAHEVQEAVHEVKEEAANHVQEVAHQVEEDHSSEVKLHSAPHFEEVAHEVQEAAHEVQEAVHEVKEEAANHVQEILLSQQHVQPLRFESESECDQKPRFHPSAQNLDLPQPLQTSPIHLIQNHQVSLDILRPDTPNQVAHSSQIPITSAHIDNHLAQIDQMINLNSHKLQALNPIGSELNASHDKSQLSDGEFQKIQVPLQQHIEFKAGDLIYSGEMHINETENLMQDILNDHAHLLAKNPQSFNQEFGDYLNKK